MSLYLDLYRVYTPSCTVDFHVQRSMQRKFSESCTQIRHRSERYKPTRLGCVRCGRKRAARRSRVTLRSDCRVGAPSALV